MSRLEYSEAVRLLEEAGYTQEEIDELMTDIQIPVSTIIPFPDRWQKE